MEKFNSYQERKQNNQQVKLNYLLGQLPEFCKEYFNDPDILALSSKEVYAREILSFLNFIESNHSDMNINTIDVLENISSEMIEDYKSYLRRYEKNGKEYKNSSEVIKRKVFMIKAFYEYYYQNQMITKYPDCFVLNINRKCKKDKKDTYESEQLIENAISAVATAQNLHGKQYIYADKTHKRDLAIIRVLCCTGISLSQCVSLNCEDIDWEKSSINVWSKKGRQNILIDQKTLKSLEYYMNYERKNKKNKSLDGNALFLSMQDRRMTGRAIQKMIKKYVEDSSKPMDYRNARRLINHA